MISSTVQKVSAVLAFALIATSVPQRFAQSGEPEHAPCIPSDSNDPKSYDCWFESEPVDPAWAPQVEAMIWSLASAIGEVDEIECRTNICRAVFTPSEAIVELDVEERRLNWKVGDLNRDGHILPSDLSEYFRPAIDGSGGRPGNVSSITTWSGSPGDRPTTKVHMIGRFDMALISEQSSGP